MLSIWVTRTCPAITSAIIPTGIKKVIRMPLGAMRLLGILGGKPATTKGIRSWRHQFQVFRIYASRIAAEMIPFKAVCRLANKEMMGKNLFGRDGKSAIAALNFDG